MREGPIGDALTSPTIPAAPVRLRTLVLIRWIATAGQVATVLAVHYVLAFPLPLFLCLAVIAILALSNVVLVYRRPAQRRLAHRDAAMLLGFDVVQLGVLLYLTGGLTNPFAILILAPVLVSATIMSRRATIALTLLAVVTVTVLSTHHLPLPWRSPELDLPLVYILGIWTALAVASVFISAYVWSVAVEARHMSEALAETQASLARSQRLSALDGLAAAAAHELGSPLSTIAVVANELARELPSDSPHAEDIILLLDQSERCREILADLAREPTAGGGDPFERLPFSALLEAVASRSRREDIALAVVIEDEPDGAEPVVVRRPELLHGLGNLIQNAVEFAAGRVELRLYWNAEEVRVTVSDDGPGFPAMLIDSIGEPYISTREESGEHMGLGIFIAQTLLERAGASLAFRNRGGAEVVISWPRVILEGLTA
ncbi:MAG: ActS/PrrB/RegB family redox-sensitive histidine kinase [Alphaproteobacteria bacterium]|nr:ActS/PrrB/RegB family redox-sensitive histidine kinase [Alphaproteobacteria bacterium]